MKGVREFKKIDKKTHGTVSTLLTAVVLAVLLVGAIIGTELSRQPLRQSASAQTLCMGVQHCATANNSSMMLANCGDCPAGGTATNGCSQGYTCSNPAMTCKTFVTPPIGIDTLYPVPCNLLTPTPATADFCTDTDGGSNIYQEGTVNFCVTILGSQTCGSNTDVCNQPNQLTEFSCNGNTRVQTANVCPNGCASNGQCLPATATPTPTDYPFPAACTCTGLNHFQCQQKNSATALCSPDQSTTYPPTGPGGWNCRDCTAAPTATTTPAPVCSDSDGENSAPTPHIVAGTTTLTYPDGSTTSNVDSCSTTILGGVKEYFCLGATISSNDLVCPTGYTCVGGACNATAATATPTPDAVFCTNSCNATVMGSSGYCSTTATTCPSGGTLNSVFASCNASSACCCTTNTVPTNTPTLTPTAIACSAAGTCGIGYNCQGTVCVTQTPTPTFTPVPTSPPTPTCFTPQPATWSPGVARNGDNLIIGWTNPAADLTSIIEVCTNGGGQCTEIFKGKTPQANTLQKTVANSSSKDIIVKVYVYYPPCDSTSNLISQELLSGVTYAGNPIPTVGYSNGTSAWLIVGGALIIIIIIVIAIVAA